MQPSNKGIRDLIASLEALDASGASIPPPRWPPLNNAGGSDKFPDMEARINKLEEHVGNIRVDVASIKSDLEHLPSKDYIRDTLRNQLIGVSIIVAIVGGVVGVAAHLLPHG